MKKKMFAIAMASVMAASLTACGGGEKETTAAATEAATTAAETSAEAEESETAAEGESAAEAAAEVTTVNEGKLTVATSPDFAPYEFYAIGEDGTPQLAGFDMALAQYIADDLGLELEVVTVDFDGVLSELSTKSVEFSDDVRNLHLLTINRCRNTLFKCHSNIFAFIRSILW